MEQAVRDQIAFELQSCVERTFERLKSEDTHRPFHSALLSTEALLWSRFERSFSTSFGQTVVERISRLAAIAGGATEAETQRETHIRLPESTNSAIEAHVTLLRSGITYAHRPWDTIVTEIRGPVPTTSATLVDIRVISDLWWVKDDTEHFLSIKTVKPNLDQTAEAKRDLLKLTCAHENHKVYFGLYYNPYGEARSSYRWNPPRKIFDVHNDPVILIGRDYWDTLGGAGFYDELIQVCAEVGDVTRDLISTWSQQS